MGLWRPATADALKVRRAIADDPAGWKRAAYGEAFGETYDQEGGERLVRVPRGFDPDHPYADDLRRKDFTGWTRLTKRQVTSGTLLEDYTARCRTAMPFMRFLCKALGVSI